MARSGWSHAANLVPAFLSSPFMRGFTPPSTRVAAFLDTIVRIGVLAVHGERIAAIALAEPEEAPGAGPAIVGPIAFPGKLALGARAISYRYGDNEPPVCGLRLRCGCRGVYRDCRSVGRGQDDALEDCQCRLNFPQKCRLKIPHFVTHQSRPKPRGGSMSARTSRSSSTMAWRASAVALSRRLLGKASHQAAYSACKASSSATASCHR